MTQPLGYLGAFAGGLLSFFAPCSLALVPVWLSYVLGLGLEGPAAGRRRLGRALFNLALFGAGFTLVFVLLGSSLGALSQWAWAGTPWLNRIGGTVLILLGLARVDLLPFLRREWRLELPRRPGVTGAGSLLLGFSFAAGWTPCVGPVLGSILVLAGASGSVRRGALLLLVYSLGLLVPFFAAALLTDFTAGLLRRSGRWLQALTYASSVLLIAFGVVVFTGLLSQVLAWLPLPAAFQAGV